jgi:hypothetical protein
MKSLYCNCVLGYTETKSICEDVCVLSAIGTAAVVDESFFIHSNAHEPIDYENQFSSSNSAVKNCKLCHVNYSDSEPSQLPVALFPCNMCNLGQVPDILFTSIQPMPEIEIIGQGCLLRVIVTRPHKKCTGEISAKIISDYLPFMEYELHRQLLGKLKLKGMNMLYGLHIQVSIGENMLIGLAEGTACYAAALPAPSTPKIISEKTDRTQNEIDEIERLKKVINDEVVKNREFFNLDLSVLAALQQSYSSQISQFNDTSESQPIVVNSSSNDTAATLLSKALFKIELDDVREKENIYLLMDSNLTQRSNFYACSTEYMPGIERFNRNLQMFTSIYRCETSLVQMSTMKFNEIYNDIMQSLQYKFRRYKNCCLMNLSFDNSLYDDDHAMVIVTGCCLTFSENSVVKSGNKTITKNGESSSQVSNEVEYKKSNDKRVEITNLSYVPNAYIESYLGHINLFLIRESTQIKENGGLSGFIHCFTSEMLALSRAHVLSLGGNALVSFKMNECVLLDNPHKVL